MDLVVLVVGVLVLSFSPRLVRALLASQRASGDERADPYRRLNNPEPGSLGERWMTISMWIVVIGVGLILTVVGAIGVAGSF